MMKLSYDQRFMEIDGKDFIAIGESFKGSCEGCYFYLPTRGCRHPNYDARDKETSTPEICMEKTRLDKRNIIWAEKPNLEYTESTKSEKHPLDNYSIEEIENYLN